MADRVAILSSEASKARKRKAFSPKQASHAHNSTNALQHQNLKASLAGKFQRTDTQSSMSDHNCCYDNSTQHTADSSHTCYEDVRAEADYNQHDVHQLEASEEFDAGSGSEVDGPVLQEDDKYIKGTRLVIGGWFQACRGCNEPTAHRTEIRSRDVPLCQRCKSKYTSMVTGTYPLTVLQPDHNIEPLCYWLPRMLPPMPVMEQAARQEFCDQLVLRQDDAWLELIRVSLVAPNSNNNGNNDNIAKDQA